MNPENPKPKIVLFYLVRLLHPYYYDTNFVIQFSICNHVVASMKKKADARARTYAEFRGADQKAFKHLRKMAASQIQLKKAILKFEFIKFWYGFQAFY